MNNRDRLRAIKATRGLSAGDIAALTHRQPGTIRQYLCGALETPADFLELLELKLGLRAPESSRVCGDEKTTTRRSG